MNWWYNHGEAGPHGYKVQMGKSIYRCNCFKLSHPGIMTIRPALT